jgi:hypothetical protein
MHEAFKESLLGVTTAVHPNHDPIMEIRFLRNLQTTQLKPFLGETIKPKFQNNPPPRQYWTIRISLRRPR